MEMKSLLTVDTLSVTTVNVKWQALGLLPTLSVACLEEMDAKGMCIFNPQWLTLHFAIRNYGDSSASPPDASKRPSPNKKRKIDETLPKTQVSKFIDRSKSIHSVPVSRDSSPAMAHRSVVSTAVTSPVIC